MANLNDVLKDKERTYLWEECKAPLFDDKIDQLRPNVIPYIIENSKSCVVICPGGGYEHKAYHEGEPVALWLNSIGVSAFVVDYRVAPAQYPAPLLDAKKAVSYVRSKAKEFIGIEKLTDQATLENVIQENIEPNINFKYYSHKFKNPLRILLKILTSNAYIFFIQCNNL